MRNRHYILFFLAGSLLLLPVASYYGMSWKEKYAKFIKDDTVQKIMPVGVLALGLAAGGLYYYWMSSNSGGEVNKSGVNLKQLQVYSQFNSDGGGGASCGYQTLLRAMQVVKAKSEDERDEDLEKTLIDQSSIPVYFGPDGQWRKEIIARRKDQKLREIMHENFISTLMPNCDDIIIQLHGEEIYRKILDNSKKNKIEELGDKAKDLYKSALGFLEEIVVVISRDPRQNVQEYEFTDEAICNYLVKSLDQVKNETNDDLVLKLQLSESITRCFNLEEMRCKFLSRDFLMNLSTLMEKIYNMGEFREDFSGEWLSDGEVEYLWEENNNEIVPRDVQCGFKAIANFDLVGNKDIDPEFDEVAIYVKDNVKQFLNEKRQFFQVFALGTMRQGSDTSGSRGHWYPLVMHQNVEGNRQYYIMDSDSNSNRLKDMNAWKIINLIEQQVVIESSGL